MRGRKPKPPRLKLLTGNPGKRPIKAKGPIAPDSKARVATCPAWLAPEAKKEWKRIAPQLSARGLLSPLDRNSLAVYCTLVARMLRCRKIIEAEGESYEHNGLRKKHPIVGILEQTERQLAVWSRELGLTPSARRGHEVDEPEQEEEFEAFLRRGTKGG